MIDDATLEKVGEKPEGIAWLHSSTLGKEVLALNPVVPGWTDGEVYIPVSFWF